MADNAAENKLLLRILQKADSPDLLEALTTRISLSDLQSLLLAVYRSRAARRSPPDLLRQYLSNPSVRPAAVSPKELVRLDELAFSLLPPQFEVVELSPVSPYGACSALAPVDQNNVVTTIRNTEVCSDATNVLALEAARRRKSRASFGGADVVRLCASHRLLRAQVFRGTASFPHFRILSLCTAGRDRGDFAFQAEALTEHVGFYTRLLLELIDAGYEIASIRVRVIAYEPAVLSHLKAMTLEQSAAGSSMLTIDLDQDTARRSNYYTGLRFQIYATDRGGKQYMLADGGLTNWTQQLLSNKKEQLLTSGMGTERLLSCFR